MYTDISCCDWLSVFVVIGNQQVKRIVSYLSTCDASLSPVLYIYNHSMKIHFDRPKIHAESMHPYYEKSTKQDISKP